jgi:adenine-specific DNA-methyltransferase
LTTAASRPKIPGEGPPNVLLETGHDNDPLERLQGVLRGTVAPEKFDAMRGTVSEPFQPGEHQRIAVKVIDFRGNEATVTRSLTAEYRAKAKGY